MGFPPNWTRDESILALDLYRREGAVGQEHPGVLELSRTLKELTPLPEQGDPAMFRNPSGVAMKLANLLRLDPEVPGGLDAGSRLDEEVWREFEGNSEGLSRAAQEIRDRVPQRTYWTWVANPKVFRVDDAIRERTEDRWLTKGKPVKLGDRGVVWRSLGSDGKRGVIAIGEVNGEPHIASAGDDPYWLTPDEESEEFVGVRYVDLDGLPIWSGTPALDDLGLSADRARGGTLFHLEPDQWLRLLEIAREQRAVSKGIGAVGESEVGATGRNVYVVRAGKGGVRSKDFEEHGIVAIGFKAVGDLNGLDKKAAKQAIADAFEGAPAGRIRTFTWQLIQFAIDINVGDIVITPEGASGPLLVGEVTGEYEYRDPPTIEGWRHTRSVRWLGRRDRAGLSNKTRKSLGAGTTVYWPESQDELLALVLGSAELSQETETLTMDWLESETLWPREDLDELVRTLEISSPQVILAGPPGTGKTWVAERVARYLTRNVPGATRLVQFHPSYSYEDFIEGLRPVVEEGAVSFQRVDGVVLEMTSEIEEDDHLHVLVVDEMNRANLPRVFGELMYLFEYRQKPVDLRYTRSFSLPSNLRFIGTMNTADRSIRSIDVALRRRFDVFECQPDSGILRRFYQSHSNEVGNLVEGFENLNASLEARLDRHHTIGHTFFMTSPMTRQELERVWERKVGPLIEEYFFDQPDLAAEFSLERFWA